MNALPPDEPRLPEPPEPPTTAAEPPAEEFHCPNCLQLGDPSTGEVFWACQNLCIRD